MPDHPWPKYPNNEVFRHSDNRKWFALIMDVSKNRLGLNDPAILDIVNFKCDPVLIGSLLGSPGIFPAYHMNKDNWISVALDGTASDNTIRMLLDLSFSCTASKSPQK